MSEIFVSKAALTEAVYLSMHDNPHKDGKIRHNHNMEHHHFIHMIYLAPVSDVVPVVHGRWIMGVDEADYAYGECSVCGYIERDAFPCGRTPKYCSECGAKMDALHTSMEEDE